MGRLTATTPARAIAAIPASDAHSRWSAETRAHLRRELGAPAGAQLVGVQLGAEARAARPREQDPPGLLHA